MILRIYIYFGAALKKQVKIAQRGPNTPLQKVHYNLLVFTVYTVLYSYCSSVSHKHNPERCKLLHLYLQPFFPLKITPPVAAMLNMHVSVK